MDQYTLDLGLLYFKETINYDLLELKRLLGLQQRQLDSLLCNLIENGFIEYIDYELKITEKGLLHLISQNKIMYSTKLDEDNSVDKECLTLLSEPYVPKGFETKI